MYSRIADTTQTGLGSPRAATRYDKLAANYLAFVNLAFLLPIAFPATRYLDGERASNVGLSNLAIFRAQLFASRQDQAYLFDGDRSQRACNFRFNNF